MILTIARRELAGLLHSPLAWVLLAFNQLILAWMFLRVLERFAGLEAAQRTAGLTQELTLNLFGFAGALALFSVPLLCMRLFSEELRNGSFTLMISAPVSLPQILFGKLLGLAGMLAALAVLPLLLCLSLLPWSPLDLGMLMAAELGLLLVLISFAAIGLYFSTLTSQPQAAAAGAYGALLLLSVSNQVSAFDHAGIPLLGWLAWNEHFLPFLLGLVRTSDLAYFLILTGLFLALILRRLQRHRVDS
jgi:ABC-2 type transport system permease protein